MSHFEIDVQANAKACWDHPQNLSIRSGQTCFTELIRQGSDDIDQYLQAPPIQFAFWILDNWWRLRWEPVLADTIDPEWRLAHELSAIGGGYIWPRLTIWGEDTRVGLACRSDSLAMNFALRFKTDALLFVSAKTFERSIDDFLDRAIEAVSDDKAALNAQFTALKQERNDHDIATWRRIEAKLGYDVDKAPDELLENLFGYMDTYGEQGVEEAIVASQGSMAAAALEEEIQVAKGSRVICKLDDAVAAAGKLRWEENRPIWEIAEQTAARVRQRMGGLEGPLRNTRLAELLNTSKEHFRTRESESTKLYYGLRLRNRDGEDNAVAVRARWSQGRRFELCRTLGDAIWSGNDALGPMTRTKTGRQKFQRAFAQSLLCPYDDLVAYINTQDPSEEDISAAARHFHVSERVIQSVLVNKGEIARAQFNEMVEAA